MKHSHTNRPTSNGAQLVQAVFTMMVLGSIYMWSNTFDDTPPSLYIAPQKPAILSSKYWNEKFGYGFETKVGDTYERHSSDSVDQVSIRSGDGVVYNDHSVRVSFYSGASIDDIEADIHSEKPRTYSRLPNGIAIVEGDLSSERAKMVLATLHTR